MCPVQGRARRPMRIPVQCSSPKTYKASKRHCRPSNQRYSKDALRQSQILHLTATLNARNLLSLISRQQDSATVLPNSITYLGPCSLWESLSLNFQRSFSQATDIRKTIVVDFLYEIIQHHKSQATSWLKELRQGLTTMWLFSPAINGKCLQEPGGGPEIPLLAKAGGRRLLITL